MGPLEFGYQGLPRDPEGRFVTADPKGYVDGPSMYAFEMDDTANGSDPMGTCDKGETWTDCLKRMAAEVAEKAKEVAQAATEFVGGVAQGIAGSVTLDLLPGAKPKDTDSKAQRVGQIAGATLVSVVGTQATITEGAATLAACASIPATGLETYGGDRQKVEESLNFFDVSSLFGRRIGETTDEEDWWLLERLARMWHLCLHQLFPDRCFIVEVLTAQQSGDEAGIIFYQRSAPAAAQQAK